MSDGPNTSYIENSQTLPFGIETQQENPIEQSLQLAREGKYFDAFTIWFEATQTERDNAVHNTWMNMAATGTSYLRDAMKDPSLSEDDRFISRNLAILISLTGERLFGPQPQELTLREINGLYEYPVKELIRGFRRRRRTSSEETGTYQNTAGHFDFMVHEFNRKWGTDFTVGNAQVANLAMVHRSEATIRENFTNNEIALFLKRIIPRIKRDDIPDSEIGEYLRRGFVDMPRHQFIYSDPELGKYFSVD